MRRSLRSYVPLWSYFADRFANRAMRKLVDAAPAVSIETLGENQLGRITGTVVPFHGKLLVSPLAKRACVYWTASISAWGSDAGPTWVLSDSADAVTFTLEQQGHRAVIDPASAQIGVANAHVSRCAGPFDADPEQHALLVAEKLLKRNWWDTQVLVFTEGVIAPGTMISVVGAGVREADPDGAAGGAYRTAGQTRVRLTGSKRFPLWITDQVRVHQRPIERA